MTSIIRKTALTLAPLAAAISVTPAAAATPPQQLAPAARWSLAVEPESCALARTFGSGLSQIVLQLEAFRPGDDLTISLIGPPIDGYTRIGPLNLRFLPDGAQMHIMPEFVRRIHVTSNGLPLTALLVYADLAGRKRQRPADELPPLPEPDLARLNALSVNLGGSTGYELQLGSMLAPIKALRGCVDTMVRRWGFDPAAAALPKGQPEPVGSPGQWATDLDYPADGMSKRIESDVHFRLAVDPAGKVTDCVVQDRFPPRGFGELTCKLLRERAHFRPALDTAGNAIASYYVSNVRWRIPGR